MRALKTTYLRTIFCGFLALITVFSYAAEPAKPSLRNTLRHTVIPDFSQRKQSFMNILAELQLLSKIHDPAGRGINIYQISQDLPNTMQVERTVSLVRKTVGPPETDGQQDNSIGGKRDFPDFQELSISMTSASVWDIIEQLSAVSSYGYIIDPKLGGVLFLERGCLPSFNLSVYEVKGKYFGQSLEKIDFEKVLGYHGINFHKGKYAYYQSYCRYHKPSGRLLVYYDTSTTYQIEKILNIEPVDVLTLNRGPFDSSRPTWLQQKLPEFQVKDVPPGEALALLQQKVGSKSGGKGFSYVLPNHDPGLVSGTLTLNLIDTDAKTVLGIISDTLGINYIFDNGVVLFLPNLCRLYYKTFAVDSSIFEGAEKSIDFDVMEWFEQFGVTFPTLSSGEKSFAAYDRMTQTLAVMTTRDSLEELQEVLLKLTPDTLEAR